MSLSEAEYLALAEPELGRLLAVLDDFEGLEAELASDILTLEFEDGVRFVINSHRAARQIWMAAGTRAWHFDYDPARSAWIASKGGVELWAALEAALTDKLGRELRLRRS